MSDIITSGALHSELSLAAYATNLPTGEIVPQKLIDAGMTKEQAQAFANKYTVVEQFDGVKGGSMTVFEDAEGNRYLSVRGTEKYSVLDYFNDIVFAFSGYNFQLNELRDKVQEWLVPASGVLTPQFEVDGHSAGGFTAIALTKLFPDNITHAYVYNSPGTDGFWGNFATRLGLSVPDSKVTSFGTAGGISIIAGLGSTAGETQIFVNTGSNYSHKMDNLNNGMQNALFNFQNFMNTLPASDKDIITQQLPDFRDFYLQGDSSVMNATAGDQRAFMLGGDGSDKLHGGKLNDYLAGGEGNDILTGAKGDDTLNGGAGVDTYIYNIGDGNDTIVDSDRKGRIIITRDADSILINMLYSSGNNTWTDATGKIQLVHGADWQLLFEDGGSINLGNTFQSGDFGISLEANTPAPEITGITLNGDQKPILFTDVAANGNSYDHYKYDDLGNIIASGSEPGRADTLYGSTQNDRISGGDGADTLYGRAGDDILDGGAGNDLISGETGNDQLIGGVGSDAIRGGDGDDTLYADQEQELADLYLAGETGVGTGARGDLLSGESGDDQLYGAAGNDVLLGGAGKDVIIAGAGDDTIEGDGVFSSPSTSWDVIRTVIQEGNTTLYQREYTGVGVFGTAVEQGDDDIYAGAGNDWVFAQGGNDFVDAGTGNDVVFGEGGDDIILGQAGDDVLSGDSVDTPASAMGNDYIDGGDGNDKIWGNGGNDDLYGGAGDDLLAGGTGDDYLEGGAGNDQLWGDNGDSTGDGRDYLSGGTGNDQLQGGGGDDELYGDEGNDILFGQDGNDTLAGGAGVDYLIGGSGNDTYIFEAGDSPVELTGNTIMVEGIDDREGVNNIILPDDFRMDTSHSSVGENGEIDYSLILNYGGNDTLTLVDGLRQTDHYSINGVSLRELIAENVDMSFNIGGSEAADTLQGNMGNNYLSGGGGDDMIDSSGGDDTMDGGAGSDTYVFGRGYGHDTINNLDTGSGKVDALIFADDVAAADIGITRTNDDLTLTILDSGDAVTIVNYFSGDGHDGNALDEIRFPADNLVYSIEDIKQLALLGSNADDSLVGYATADTILGGAGNDTIDGRGGDDIIDGGAGDDLLAGGQGSDIYLFGRGSGHDTINNLDTGSGKVDALVLASDLHLVDLSIRRQNDNLTLTILDSGDMVTIANYFSGDGHDGYAVDEIRITADNLVYGIEDVMSLSRQASDGDDNLFGSVAADTLSGLAGNDVIYGLGGNDTLDGGAGDDTMDGGTGSDTYLFGRGSGHDTINNLDTDSGKIDALLFAADVAAADIGTTRINDDLTLTILDSGDTVTIANYFSGDGHGGYALDEIRLPADNLVYSIEDIKRLALLGSNADDTLVGYATADTILGGAGSDIIDGRGGDDIMDGGVGSDTYLVGVGSGHDTINNLDTSSGKTDALVLGSGLRAEDIKIARTNDDLTLAILNSGDQVTITNYFSGDGLDGHALDEIRLPADNLLYSIEDVKQLVLQGSNANDTLVGYATADSISGLGGNDTIDGRGGDDTLSGGDGNDILLGGDGNDIINGDDGNDILVGGAGNDTLTGGLGDDTLDGGTGADVMAGSLGDDTYLVDSIEDVIVEVADQGDDTIKASISVNLGNNIENVILMGDANINATGNDADNYLTGNSGNNILNGGLGADSMEGGDGNDTYYTDNQDDSIYEQDGAGIDTEIRSFDSNYLLTGNIENLTLTGLAIYGNGNELDNIITGNDADNNLWGGEGNDTLIGGGGDDALFGGEGQDVLIGGVGDDYYEIDDAGDLIVEAAGEGDDFVRSTVSYTLSNNIERAAVDGMEDLALTGNMQDNGLWGNQGDNLLTGGKGNDYLEGGAGDDTYVFNRGDGQDTINTTDAVDATDTLRFGADVLDTDVIARRDGDNLVFSIKNSTDYVIVMDHYVAGANGEDNAIDRVEFANNVVWDAAMIQSVADRADNNHAPTVNSYLPTLQARAGSLFTSVVPVNTITDPDSWDSITYSATMADGSVLPTWLSFDSVTRTFSGTPGTGNIGSLQFVLWGTDNYGYGTGEYVTITVGQPNHAPTLATALADQSGSEGLAFSYTVPTAAFSDPDAGDTLTYSATMADGSALPSWLSFSTSTRAFSGTPPIGSTGTISVKVTAKDTGNLTASDIFDLRVSVPNLTLTGTSGVDTLTGGGGNDTLSGLAGNDRLVGNAGNDKLDGGAGNDTMLGGLGNDTYVVDSTSDVVTENANEGIDTVQSSVTLTLAANVENLTLTGTTAINGTGNTLDNVLTGNSAINTLTGGAGNDTLDGGAGADKLIGGTGDDTYIVDNTADVITENANEGTDTVKSSVTLTLAANTENLTLTGTAAINGTGNASNNIITGNSGINTLNGGAGADTLVGGAGNDIYTVDNVGDVITENANEGTDLVNSSVTYTLAANTENLTLTGTTAINGTGNELDNILTGNSAINILTGGAGNDTLNGGAGNDTMLGGLGNDTYVVDSISDVVTENANEGIDTVQSSVTLTLAANVENLTLTGTTAINGTGNTLDNVLTGNSAINTLTGGAGNDTLDGGAGADKLLGGAGDDIYIVDNTADVITENANEGTDTVKSSVTLTLAANTENLTLTGTAAINGTGNTLNNILIGNSAINTLTGGAGNDTLDGGAGADKLIGGAGNDTYFIDNSSDTITENVAEGTDTVNSSITYTLATNLENLTLTGTTAINGTGNTVDNVLIGNSAVNSLSGGAGNDTLNGGSGNDILTGGTGNDTYILGRGYGVDTVVENDATAGNTDVAQFQSGIATDQLWFQHVGNNLEVSIIGTTDKFTIQSWYTGSQYHLEQFKSGDGKVLLDTQVDALVNAMASFTAPASGQTTLPQNYQTSLAPVLAANWH